MDGTPHVLPTSTAGAPGSIETLIALEADGQMLQRAPDGNLEVAGKTEHTVSAGIENMLLDGATDALPALTAGDSGLVETPTLLGS